LKLHPYYISPKAQKEAANYFFNDRRLGGFIVTLKLLRIKKSAMEEDETLFVLLPAIDVLEMIQTIAEYK
jgi:hypothetical protein